MERRKKCFCDRQKESSPQIAWKLVSEIYCSINHMIYNFAVRALSTLSIVPRLIVCMFIVKTINCGREWTWCMASRAPVNVIYWTWTYFSIISERRSSGCSGRLGATLDLRRHKETDSTERWWFAMKDRKVPDRERTFPQGGRARSLICHKDKDAAAYVCWPVTHLRNIQPNPTELAKKVCPRLRHLATAPAGGITKPRTHFFGQLCMTDLHYCIGFQGCVNSSSRPEAGSRHLLSGVDFWVRKCVKTTAILFRSPRAFPLSVWANLRRELRIFTHKYLHHWVIIGLLSGPVVDSDCGTCVPV